MKSFLASLALVLIIIIGSIIYTMHLEKLSADFSDSALHIYTFIENGDFSSADRLTKELKSAVSAEKVLLDATGNHTEVSEIELQLDRLEEFIVDDSTKPDALAVCRNIHTLFSALPENYRIRPENIL